MVTLISVPSRTWPSRYCRQLELPAKRAVADAELGRYRSEGDPGRVPLRRGTDLRVGHLARVSSAIDTVTLQVADDRGSVDPVFPGETVDGLAVGVPGHDLVDLIGGQPALMLAGTRFHRNVLILSGSPDHLLQCCPQLMFRE